MLDADKSTWEEEKKNIQNIIYELNDYSTHEERSPTTLVIKDMSEISLKNLEITQLKEDNQDIKDKIIVKESEDAAKKIRTLKEKVTRFEERVIGRIPLQGAKHFLWDAMIK